MYVYKKKCDEDYYISIIQQQLMFQNQQRANYQPSYQTQFYNGMYPQENYLNNLSFNNNNNYNYNPYKTPENRNNSQTFNKRSYMYNNNNYNMNSLSPSPMPYRNGNNYDYNNNGNRKHIMEDQILYNKLNSINDINNNQNMLNFQKRENNFYGNKQNNFYNQNNNINKKIFKLEDFLSDTKRTNLNNKFNRVANEGFN